MRRFALCVALCGCGTLSSPKTVGTTAVTTPGAPAGAPGTGTPASGTPTTPAGTPGGTPGGTPAGTPGGTTSTIPASCAELLALNPSAPTGIHTVQPPGTAAPVQVYCDMATDGGGWTLVGSSVLPLSDQAAAWHPDLVTLSPSGTELGIWDGLRPMIIAGGGRADLRFACTPTLGGNIAVDLSFYDTTWYAEITRGTEADSCFNENDGLGADPPPARRNNLTGDFLPAGDPWNAGYLEGEDACDAYDDFTVDFDDRGMNSDEEDGTDWGEDDGVDKCGLGQGIGFFLFVRE